MQTYTVKRDFPHSGRIYRKDQQIELTERQARHLRLAGFIEPKKPEVAESAKTAKATKLKEQAKA